MFREYIAQLKGAEATRIDYRYIGRSFIEYLDRNHVRIVRAKTVVGYYDEMKDRGLADATIAHHDRVLRAVTKYGARHGIIHGDFMTRVPRPKIRKNKNGPNSRPFSAEEILKMLRAANDRPDPYNLNDRDIAILYVLYDTGMRLGALVELKLDDLDLDGYTVNIKEKGGKPDHPMGFGDDTALAIRIYLLGQRKSLQKEKEPGEASQYLFLSRNNGQLGIQAVYKIVQKLCLLAGVPRRKAHLLRYSWCGSVLEAGMPKSYVRKQLGHTSDEMIDAVYGIHVEEKIQVKLAHEFSPGDQLKFLSRV